MTIELKPYNEIGDVLKNREFYCCPRCSDVYYKTHTQLARHVAKCVGELDELDDAQQDSVTLASIGHSYYKLVFKEHLHHWFLELSASHDDLVRICDVSFKTYCSDRGFNISSTELYGKTLQFVNFFFKVPDSLNDSLLYRFTEATSSMC